MNASWITGDENHVDAGSNVRTVRLRGFSDKYGMKRKNDDP